MKTHENLGILIGLLWEFPFAASFAPLHNVLRTPVASARADEKQRPQSQPSALRSVPDPGRPEAGVTFGSANMTSGGVAWGASDDEDEDLRSRRARVEELLAESDKEMKETRRQKQWGKYANITNEKDLEKILEDEKKQLDAENSRKAQLAKASGVDLELLEPKEDSGMSSTAFDETGNIQIRGSGLPSGWLEEVDQDLQAEWESLAEGNAEGNADPTKKSATWMETALNDEGKVVARDSLAGVRVGSAGGWTLEVFPGDFVVHRKYGIGRFDRTCLRPKTKLTAEEEKAQKARRAELLTKELRRREQVTPAEIQIIQGQFGTENDTDTVSNPQVTVLEIAYADAIVHVPVDRAYRLSRYRASNTIVKPKLSRVRGNAWRQARERVESSTLQLAQDVLALYATRETLKRDPFNPNLEDVVAKFGESFKFEPTVDQVRCFEEIENDMVWRSRPMDRLVCGDVGFGKTEVALRAIYRCLVNGRQAALLAPTGVLAAQHYKNIVARMGPGSPYNITVAILRGGAGKTTKAGKLLRDAISTGENQLVVGTHALLTGVSFKDLGLLVIDEEQRFGVKQKERLKLVCKGVDVLTLSATPIPRTLQMSLSGIRDTSTIRSPPPMRKPTITYVQDFHEDLVKMAISEELDRNGQCYYVVPRISMLDEAEELVKKLFPDIRIIQAHGRMHRNGAEENVAEFAQGNYDVLLATTVIENGVDIPTVNTIIVQDSQAFGMSTLYQLRGRVGRSDLQAYAYFLHKEESVTEQAAMRLQAIGELNELGSGFDVANRDLEIRGAGSLLGTEQSGVAARVGFDLYMRMLKKAIRQLRGLDLPLVPRTNILFDTDGSPTSFSLPEDFITRQTERRSEESKARLAENTAALVMLTNEWKDKFGTLPAALQSQLKTLHLHACTRVLGVDLVGIVESGGGDRTDCYLRSPGLRPRHWATILPLLSKGVAPKGLDVIFPERFTVSGEELELLGGRRVDLSCLVKDPAVMDDEEDQEWDAMDEEEIEAMKDISSSARVEQIDEVDLEYSPRFVVRDFKGDRGGVNLLLRLLLPIAKVVHEKQEDQAEAARMAADLRNRQELLREKQKANEKSSNRRHLGYNG